MRNLRNEYRHDKTKIKGKKKTKIKGNQGNEEHKIQDDS